MAFIIPAARDLSAEAFTSFIVGLQQRRIQEEERKRREEAADPGGAGIGGALGGAAGLGIGALLAAPTGGLSLLAGAAIGGGIGTAAGGAVGGLVDPAGRGFPGGTLGQVAQQVQRGAGQVVQGLGIADADRRREEGKTLKRDESEQSFLERLAASPAGPLAIKGFDAFKQAKIARAQLNGGSVPTGSEIQGDFIELQADKLATLELERIKGRLTARDEFKAENAKIKLGRDNIANLGAVFDMTPPQVLKAQGFQAERELFHSLRDDGEITPKEAQERFRVIRKKEDDLFLRLQSKPQPMISVEQVLASGGRFDEGRVYSIGDPRTATRGQLYTGRSVNDVVIRDAGSKIVESETDKGLFERIDDDGKRTFSGRVRPDGKFYGIGVDFAMEGESGRFQHDKDGEIIPVKGTGADGGGDSIEEAIQGAAITLGKDRSPAEALSGATAIVSGSIDAAAELQEKIQRKAQLRKLEVVRNRQEFLSVISKMDPNLDLSLNVIRQAVAQKDKGVPLDPLALQQVRDARRTIANAFGEIMNETTVPLRIQRMMRQVERVADVLLGEQPVVREVPAFTIGQEP